MQKKWGMKLAGLYMRDTWLVGGGVGGRLAGWLGGCMAGGTGAHSCPVKAPAPTEEALLPRRRRRAQQAGRQAAPGGVPPGQQHAYRLVVHAGGHHNRHVEELVGVEGEVKGPRLQALGEAGGVDGSPRLHRMQQQ